MAPAVCACARIWSALNVPAWAGGRVWAVLATTGLGLLATITGRPVSNPRPCASPAPSLPSPSSPRLIADSRPPPSAMSYHTYPLAPTPTHAGSQGGPGRQHQHGRQPSERGRGRGRWLQAACEGRAWLGGTGRGRCAKAAQAWDAQHPNVLLPLYETSPPQPRQAKAHTLPACIGERGREGCWALHIWDSEVRLSLPACFSMDLTVGAPAPLAGWQDGLLLASLPLVVLVMTPLPPHCSPS